MQCTLAFVRERAEDIAVQLSATMSDPEARATAAPGTPPVQEILRFERLLADLSAGFINLPADRIDAAISDSLRRIVGLLRIDRANLIGFVAETGVAQVTHAWSVAGLDTVLPRSVLEDFPWAMRHLQAGHVLQFHGSTNCRPRRPPSPPSFGVSGRSKPHDAHGCGRADRRRDRYRLLQTRACVVGRSNT